MELGNNAELFMVVLDMLSILLHGTLVPDEPDGRPDNRTHQALVRKLKVRSSDVTLVPDEPDGRPASPPVDGRRRPKSRWS